MFSVHIIALYRFAVHVKLLPGTRNAKYLVKYAHITVTATSAFSECSVFDIQCAKTTPRRFEICFLESVSKTTLFLWSKKAVVVWTEGKAEESKIRFQIYPDWFGQGLNIDATLHI